MKRLSLIARPVVGWAPSTQTLFLSQRSTGLMCASFATSSTCNRMKRHGALLEPCRFRSGVGRGKSPKKRSTAKVLRSSRPTASRTSSDATPVAAAMSATLPSSPARLPRPVVDTNPLHTTDMDEGEGEDFGEQEISLGGGGGGEESGDLVRGATRGASERAMKDSESAARSGDVDEDEVAVPDHLDRSVVDLVEDEEMTALRRTRARDKRRGRQAGDSEAENGNAEVYAVRNTGGEGTEEEEEVTEDGDDGEARPASRQIPVNDDASSDTNDVEQPFTSTLANNANATSSNKEVADEAVTANKTLSASFPVYAAEYVAAGEANAVPIADVRVDSALVAAWCCLSCRHVWRCGVFVRCVLKNGCPTCTAKQHPSVAVVRPDLCQLWDIARNDPFLVPGEVQADSAKSVYWRCPTCNRSYAARVKDRVQDKARCPSCALSNLQSSDVLSQEEGALLQEWHPLKNGDLRLDQVHPSDYKTKIWWLCSVCGHDWEATLATRLSTSRRSKGRLCPACKGQGVQSVHLGPL